MSLIGDDCFFFMNAGCHRGSFCMYRHQPAAKTSIETCPNWLKGSCMNNMCTFRHSVIDSRVIPRATPSNNNIHCKYESTTGCLSDQCTFLHVNKAVKPPPSSIAQAINPAALANPIIVPNLPKPETSILQPSGNHIGLSGNHVVINGFPPSSFPPGVAGILPEPVVHVRQAEYVTCPMDSYYIAAKETPHLLGPPYLPPLIRPGLVPALPIPVNPMIIPQPQHVPPGLPPASQQQNISILGPPPQTLQSFPKNEHFTEQVKLFKEILAGKQKSDDDEEAYGDKRRHKDKERQKNRMNRKYQDSYGKSKTSYSNQRKSKNNWSKGDEEILYGDYKNVQIAKKHKKRTAANADSDSEVSYEEKLRERALRDMLKRRKEDKFKAEFENLLNEKEKYDKGKKRSIDESVAETKNKEPSIKTKRIKIESKIVSPNPEDESFSQDDAVELGLDTSPIREYLNEADDLSSNEPENDTSNNKENTDDEDTNNKGEDEDESQENEKTEVEYTKTDIAEPILVIPDETTDINFSVEDEDDELLQELNEAEQKKEKKDSSKTKSRRKTSKSHSHNRSNKSSSSSNRNANTTKKLSSKHRDKTSEKSLKTSKSSDKPKTIITSVVSVISKSSEDRSASPVQIASPKKDIEEISSSSKRKVIKIEDKSSITTTSQQAVKSPLITNTNDENENDNKENTTKVKLSVQKDIPQPIAKLEQVKVKTFDEIMAEKRKRRVQNKEILVISDDNESPISMYTERYVQPQKVKASNIEVERVVMQLPQKVKASNFEVERVVKQLPQKVKASNFEVEKNVKQHPKKVKASIFEVEKDLKLHPKKVEASNSETEKTVKPKKVKRSNSEEDKIKRQSLKLYKPPIISSPLAVSESLISATTKSVSTPIAIANTGPRKIISLKKPTLSTDIVDGLSSTRMTSTIKSTMLTAKKEGGVMSFEEIMEAKRLRKQKIAEEKRALQTDLQEKANSTLQPKKEITPIISTSVEAGAAKKSFIKRKPVIKRPIVTSTSVQPVTSIKEATTANTSTTKSVSDETSNTNNVTGTKVVTSTAVSVDLNIPKNSKNFEINNIKTSTESNGKIQSKEQMDSKVARVSPLHVVPSQILYRSESLTEEQLLGDVTPTTPVQPDITSVEPIFNGQEDNSASVVPRLSYSPISSTAPLPNVRKMSSSTVIDGGIENLKKEVRIETTFSPSSMKDIKEALDEEKRKQQEDLLSDDEFEKEINDLCSGDDDDEDYGDIDEDDLMMELQEMIDS